MEFVVFSVLKVLSCKQLLHEYLEMFSSLVVASLPERQTVSPITVYDVAAKAKVSISTVSRVLNAPDKVNDATRVRVLAAIDSLGFVPKAEAAARARKSSGRIGVLAPFFTLPSFVERLRGVAHAVADSAFELAIYSVDSSSHRDGYLASLPLTRRVDGLIVMALPFDESAIRRLVAHDLATVLIEFSQEPFSSIRIDDRAGGRLAAQFLLEKGHRRFAFVGDADLPDYAIHTSDWRLEGFCQALAEAGVSLPAELHPSGAARPGKRTAIGASSVGSS